MKSHGVRGVFGPMLLLPLRFELFHGASLKGAQPHCLLSADATP
ncbi:MAG TPA: hypothetical protein VGI93_20255 [Steroidobacteraceae bacterium]|jgi:hypothetical protein